MPSFNINNLVRFKLTARGLELHRKHWDDLDTLCQGRLSRISPYQSPSTDKDGWTMDQLWNFMNIYGQSMAIGSVNVIEDNIIVLHSTDLIPHD